MAQGDGSLPLLQFALAELWEARDRTRGCITQGALEAMGGVSGALSRHADGILKRLSPAEREAAHRLFVRLVTAEGTRATRSEADLDIINAPAAAAARALVDGRLLQAREADGTTVYEIAHEALIVNWGTLRNWLDEDIGQRAIRQRLETAAHEWERLDKGDELLWGARQLSETFALDTTKLSPRERAFLRASSRTVRRRRLGRILAALALPFLGSAIYASIRLQAHYQDARAIADLLGQADEALVQGRALADKAIKYRGDAVALFDGRLPPATPPPKEGTWEAAERVWDEALAFHNQAQAVYDHADRKIAAALLHDSHHPEAQRRQGELLYERYVLAEEFHQTSDQMELQRKLEGLDSSWAQRLHAPAEVILEDTPSGVQVRLERYVEDRGRRRLEPMPQHGKLGSTHLPTFSLPPGSYLFHLSWPGRTEEILFPVLLERGESRHIRIPRPTSIPHDYVYIAPGCFLFGSADPEGVRRFLNSPPIHRVCLDHGYLIGRTEVTLGDWIDYLNTLPAGASERSLLWAVRQSSIGVGVLTLREDPEHRWRFSFHSTADARPDNGVALEEPFRYVGRTRRVEQDWRRFPLSGISPEELQGYLAWLHRSGRVPGARLCDEFEWERAARGADDRLYPHGDRLNSDDANIDRTYGRLPETFGPDMVGAHPESTSPFGIVDMAGNVFEIVQQLSSDRGHIGIRGGSWYHPFTVALATNRSPGEPSMHEVTVGVRVCATVE
jgi:formylglycine-generating enzyme required for sulfatase activity